MSVTCLNHPKSPIPPPWPMKTLSSRKPVPGAKKDGDHCPTANQGCRQKQLMNGWWAQRPLKPLPTRGRLALSLLNSLTCPAPGVMHF